MTWTLYQGDCREVLKQFPDNHFDACVTDPPYGLEFMGKDWDNLGDAGRNRQKAIEKSSFGSIMGAKTKSPRIVRVRRRKCVACGGYSGGPFENCKCSSPTWEQDTYPQAMQDWHCQWAKEVLRVLKPGAHLLSFGGSRTYHRMACAIEDAGFEIRDQIQWIYGSGFPKSMDISKAIDKAAGAEREVLGVSNKQPAGFIRHGRTDEEVFLGTDKERKPDFITNPSTPEAQQWEGWGTALKPAHEPIALAQKPKEGTFAVNVRKYGVGGINIDGSRVGAGGGGTRCNNRDENGRCKGHPQANNSLGGGVMRHTENSNTGRFPANIILDEVAAAMLDEQSGESKSNPSPRKRGSAMADGGWRLGQENNPMHDDSGGASRFFYCAKASQAERKGSKHPTVKPLDLMKYLCRLITPPSGLILDPFAGSGTTIQAAVEEGFRVVGIEKEVAYCNIIRQRMANRQTTIFEQGVNT